MVADSRNEKNSNYVRLDSSGYPSDPRQNRAEYLRPHSLKNEALKDEENR